MKTGSVTITIIKFVYTRVSTDVKLVFCIVLYIPLESFLLRAPVFDRCKLSVMHDIYTDFTLLVPEFYQRNPLGECVFILR